MSTPGEREQFLVGFQHGLRAAISWLHGRAMAMNDPHAQSVLNSAATNLGWDAQEMTNRRAVNRSAEPVQPAHPAAHPGT